MFPEAPVTETRTGALVKLAMDRWAAKDWKAGLVAWKIVFDSI